MQVPILFLWAWGFFRNEEVICTKSCAAVSNNAQVVVFIADDLGFLGPGSPDLMTELCPPQDTA